MIFAFRIPSNEDEPIVSPSLSLKMFDMNGSGPHNLSQTIRVIMPLPESTTSEEDLLSHLPDLSSIHDLSIPFSTPIDLPHYINTHFPNEASLSSLPTFLSRLDASLSTLDNQLASLLLSHRQSTPPTLSLISTTNEAIQDLQSSLQSLSRSANDTHNQIQDALAPALPVYTALTNISDTEAALENLLVLDKAISSLEAAAMQPTLQSVADDLDVFKRLDETRGFFEKMENPEGPGLAKVPQLKARAGVATETVRGKILGEFGKWSHIISLAQEKKKEDVDEAVGRLKVACAVAEAMGEDVKREVVGVFVKGRRSAFKAAFEMDSSGFAGIERRFSWTRKELRMNWARLGGERVDRGWGKVFPEEWGVAWRVADGLIRELREWTGSTLDAGADRDVAVMVAALGKTKEFEVELDRRFSGKGEGSFIGKVSESYGPWMGAYVKQEDDHLGAVVGELLREEKWICEDGKVLKSAMETFLVIKKSMKMCAALDIKQPLFSLHRVFRKHLGVYANALVKHLPGIAGNALADSSNPKDYELKIQRACAIINTADYCALTVEQLEQTLQKTVEQVFEQDIDLSQEREKFSSVAAKGVQSLVTLLEEDVEAELRVIPQKDWANWNEVGDTSKYVENITRKLTNTANALSEQLSKRHLRFTLEKFAVAFIARYQNHIYQCQQMNNLGAQQILLDASAVKTLLLGIPSGVQVTGTATFNKLVNREMSKLEAMLKVILSPVNMSVDTYVALVPDGTAEQFQQILEMRGLRRADAAPLVLDYSRRIGPEQRLKPSSRQTLTKPLPSTPMPAKDASVNKSSGSSSEPSAQGGQNAAVDSVKSLWGRLGTSFMDSGISERLGQVGVQLESTTDRLKKEAAARGFRFGQ